MTTVATPLAWNPVSRPGHGLSMGQLAARTASIAVRALLREAEAGPKPGLVDRFGPGVHTDMDISHFRLSAAALGPFFEAITLEAAAFMAREWHTGPDTIECGVASTTDFPVSLARILRDLGLKAESAMLSATGGVNTHKGAIWTMGLLCAAVGALTGFRHSMAARIYPAFDPALRDNPAGLLLSVPTCREAGSGGLNAEAVCVQAAGLAQAILSLGAGCRSGTCPGHGMATVPPPGRTNGLAARQTYGLRSARDEALEGFPSIQARALSLARNLRDSTVAEDEKVISVLLAIMCELDDTCLVARGGLPALKLAKASARQVLEHGGPCSRAGSILYRNMVAEFRKTGLSPGGSADLCAATLFLADMEAEGCV